MSVSSAAVPLSDRVRRGELLSAACPSRDVLRHVTSRWGVLVLLVLAALVSLTPLRDEAWWRQSQSAPWLEMALMHLNPWLPDAFGTRQPMPSLVGPAASMAIASARYS